MSVDDNSNQPKKFFGPPGAFGGFGSPSESVVDKAFPVQPKISSNPAHSQLYNKQQSGVHLPELLAVIRTWHKGKEGRDQNGQRIRIPWFALETIHLDTTTVIDVSQVDVSDSDEDIHQMIEMKIEQRYRGYNEQQQRFEVRCHFRSDDGNITAWEPFTCCINLPPVMQHYGQQHYSGFNGGSFGQGYGGPFGQGGQGGGPNGGFGNFQNQHAVFLRANIDGMQRSDAVLFRALDMIENHARRLEAANQIHWNNQMEVIGLISSLQDNKARQKLDEQMAEFKMAALQTAVEKTMHALPMGIAVLNRWLTVKQEEKIKGRVTPRQEKAQNVLKAIMNEFQKNPATKDPNNARQMLKMAGVSEDTINDAFSLFQDFYIEQAIGTAEDNVKRSLLGMGEGQEDSALTKLLKEAGVKKDEGK